MRPSTIYLSASLALVSLGIGVTHAQQSAGTRAVETARTSQDSEPKALLLQEALDKCVAEEQAKNEALTRSDAQAACRTEMRLQREVQGTVPPRG